MLTVPRIPTALATIVIETFFYGIYLVLFLTSIYLLLTAQTRGLRPPRTLWLSPILLGGSLLFIAVTGHWVLTIDRLFLAFVIVDNGADPLGFYGDFSQTTQILQTIFLLVSLTIVDILVVHRLWSVWSHINRYVMIFPTLTLLGLAASTIGVAKNFSQFTPGDSVLELANGWIIADCAFTVFTNIYCTALIGWRLWRVQNALKTTGGYTLNSIVAIIVESAALSTIWAIFFVATYAARSNLRFLIDVTPAVVSAANMLIYVRVGLGWAHAPVKAPSKPIRFNVPKFNTDGLGMERELKRGDLV
ncbi:hypothetical protein DFH08DRAFT_195286 [Mycena albidolilacea]|uniref:Uncharacterized protein n=1 Tax=Mycena albidolilacea TaxID=1033008 RepID=A0AAD7EQ65_9AGAR|nr:hypothetical protein DFH08DRAFT_195286 [Mycena albidolilacea]